jgi:hypothetical protein
MMTSEAKGRHHRSAIGAGLLVGVLVFLFHLPFAPNSLFFDDAADYVRASDSSILSTWLNTNSASPTELWKLRGDDSFRSHPWDYLYMRGDNAALRHFHSPVSYYPLHLMRVVSKSAQPERLLTSLVSSITCAVIVVALAGFSVPLPLAALLGLLVGLQSRYIEPSVDPTPHTWYMLFALVFLCLFLRYLLTRMNRDLYFAAAALALTFATLEFCVELFATVVFSLFLIAFFARSYLPEWPAARKPMGKAFALFMAITLLLWPGGWLRGGYLECYGFNTGLVLLKNRTTYGAKPTAGALYHILFAGHAMLVPIAGLCLAGFAVLLVLRRLSAPAIVFGSYTLAAFALGVADHFRQNTYISEFLLFLIATAGLVMADLAGTLCTRPFTRRVALSLAALVVAAGCFSEWEQRGTGLEFRPWLAPIFSSIRAQVPPGSTLLVTDDWEALWLYLPEYRFEPTTAKNSSAPRSPLRTVQIRYYLFDGAVAPPAGSSSVAVLSTYPGRTEVLWRAAGGN